MTGTSHSDSQPQLWMTSGRSVLAKSTRMTWHSEWMPRREKFSEKAFRASSSRNRIWEGVGSKDEDAPERRGFLDGVDLHLDAIDKTNVNRKEREREKDNQKSSRQFKYIKIYWIKSTYAWECMNMWQAIKKHHGLSLIQSYQHKINLHTSKCMIILL